MTEAHTGGSSPAVAWSSVTTPENAVNELRELVRCDCAARGFSKPPLHDPECYEAYGPEVEAVAAELARLRAEIVGLRQQLSAAAAQVTYPATGGNDNGSVWRNGMLVGNRPATPGTATYALDRGE